MKRALLVVCACYVLIVLAVYLGQSKLLFLPGGEPGRTPAGLGAAWRDVELSTSDGERLGAWWIESSGAATTRARGALILCHGNAGSIEHRLPHAAAFLEMGLSVLLFDYRGYGTSTGSPSEEGTYRDVRAAYRWLRAGGWPPERVLLYGESLGGAVALQLASEVAVAGVILDHTFTSVPDLAAELYPWMPVRSLVRHRYDNLAKISDIRAPLLIVHSPRDEIIPFSHAKRLLDRAPEGARLLATSGGHNGPGFFGSDAFLAKVKEFVDVALGAQAGLLVEPIPR